MKLYVRGHNFGLNFHENSMMIPNLTLDLYACMCMRVLLVLVYGHANKLVPGISLFISRIIIQNVSNHLSIFSLVF